MLEIYTVSFFGHRKIEHFEKLEDQLIQLIQNLTKKNEFVKFLVGRNGEFDQLVSSTIRKAQKKIGNDRCLHTLVLPYETAEFRNNRQTFLEYYDTVEIFQSKKHLHFKNSILARNFQMVDRSQLIIFYLDHEFGGAFQTYQYARKQKSQIFKLKQ
ncbi:MAG: hypothetical protein E7680_04525 [Ruminococcaceae bacterium]|nr:hypothetical protein [Oscillospiraceae bacterium]